MITVKATISSSGCYVGMMTSDRWNLMQLKDLGRDYGLPLDINECPNEDAIERFKRVSRALGFDLIINRRRPDPSGVLPRRPWAMKSPRSAPSRS